MQATSIPLTLTPTMGILPLETVELITEYSCCDDFGQTARKLGLVSKSFRLLAEPRELHAIAVSGLEQLRTVFTKVERLRSELEKRGRGQRVLRKYDTKHLFICELTKEHALSIDSEAKRTTLGTSAPMPDMCALVELYRSQTLDFWILADKLIRAVSGTLETLSLVAWENWLMSTPRQLQHPNPESPNFLVTLSNASFPNLVALTVVHNAGSGRNCFGSGRYHFIHPFMPALRELHIVTPTFLGAYPIGSLSRIGHPLLANMHKTKPNLTHLTLCYDWLPNDPLVMTALFEMEWLLVRENKRLPRNLQSIVLRYGFMPRPFDVAAYHQLAKDFVDKTQKRGIAGLHAQILEPSLSGRGKRRYEFLLSEWKEKVLSSDTS